MNKIHVLDCTLRDGGYCNQWNFGYDNIKKITQGIIDANVDIIECGFLTDKVDYNHNMTKFTCLEQIEKVIPENRDNKIFVAMVNYGEYSAINLPRYDGKSIDGIRVAFHKKDLKKSIDLCKEIKAKGYKVFVQAMVSLSYSDEEFLALIHEMNQIEPYAFYIVDSFGMMKKKNLIRLFYMVENNLKEGIWIGFHSHNNMQLAYSNAQSLVDAQTNRNLIIDSSIYGMGRGAGNLNTELFVEYLNEIADGAYNLKPLLSLIDEIINDFYSKNFWGYSLPNYLSAKHWIHPSYTGYLNEKNTLTVDAMDDIFSLMARDKRFEFDRDYIEQLYVKYMETGKVHDEHSTELRCKLLGRKILLIAPGRSSEEEKDRILEFGAKKDVIIVSVNFDYPEMNSDYIFLSNLRRFRELDNSIYSKCIVTANIPIDKVYLQTKYYDLLMPNEAVRDNAGLMAMKFFQNLGATEIYLAGFDGYSYIMQQNYASEEMTLVTKNAIIDAMNEGMCQMLSDLRKKVKIKFLTTPRFIN